MVLSVEMLSLQKGLMNSCRKSSVYSKSEGLLSLLVGNPEVQASSTWWFLPHWLLGYYGCLHPACRRGEWVPDYDLHRTGLACSDSVERHEISWCPPADRGWEMHTDLRVGTGRVGLVLSVCPYLPEPGFLQVLQPFSLSLLAI